MLLNGRAASNYSPLGPNDRVQGARGGGIEWTIKDGIPYHVPTLMREVKEMVTRARTQHPRTTAPAQSLRIENLEFGIRDHEFLLPNSKFLISLCHQRRASMSPPS